MTFAHPWALLAGLAALPVILLYWRRTRVPRETVGTSMFWEKAFAEEAFRSGWQRYRSGVSLAIQLLIVALAALALAEPQIPPPRRIVLIVDNSASMNATDVKPTRLAVAKETADRLIDSLHYYDQMAILASGGRPAVMTNYTGDGKVLRAAVTTIAGTNEPAPMAATIELARGMPVPIGSPTPPRIVLATDGRFANAAKLVSDPGVELLRIGTPAGNRAITRWTARRSLADPRKCEALIEVQNISDQPAKCDVSIMLDGKPIDAPVPIELASNGRVERIVPFVSAAGGKLTARLDAADDYLLDNTATLELPPADVHRVTLVESDDAPESPIRQLLQADPRVEMASPDDKATQPPITVFLGKCPEKLPAGPVFVIDPGTCDLWTVGDAIADPIVARVDADSPILAGVRLVDVFLEGAHKLVVNESIAEVAKPIAWAPDDTPLACAIDRPQGRVIVIGGKADKGNLSLVAALPSLLANSLEWLDQRPLPAAQFAGQGIVSAKASEPAVDLRTPPTLGVDAATLKFARPLPPTWLFLAGAIVVLLVIEWCLYQRRWTT